MKLYKFDGIYCEWACGYALVLAETRQDAMEMIVRNDARPEFQKEAVELFRKWQQDGPNTGIEVSSLWSTIVTDPPQEFSLNEPILFECEGSA